MALRTYYWNSKKINRYNYYKSKLLNRPIKGFKYGNVGDIFNEDLIRFLYNEKIFNTRFEPNKLLTVGSIASVIKPNDIICGIGWKGNDLSEIKDNISKTKVYGVRGPLTKKLFEDYGADLTDFKFEYDPGLLIKEVHNLNIKNNKDKNVVFIPHYNDLAYYKNNFPKEFKILNVDIKPKNLAKEIMNSKIVYTSSLHGIIFSHALSKPCVFVAPQSKEPLFKYRDYFLSIGQSMPEPLKNLYVFNFIKDKPTTLTYKVGLKDFYFPSKEILADKKVIFTP